MIELPEWAVPNGIEPALIGGTQTMRPSTGAATQRYARPGARWRMAVTLPPMQPDRSRVVLSRLLEARRDGLRMPFPLLGVDQGSPGSPVVDGAGQTGTTLVLRGLQPGYVFREGYWLSIVADGRHYLHNCRADLRASEAGLATVPIAPALRVPFPDGAAVHLAVPMVEGFIDGDEWGWATPVNRLIAVQFPLEEVA